MSGTPNNRAFTLLELLVVSAIVVLLAGILLPSLSLVRMQVSRLRCGNNLSMMGRALNLYRTELGRYPDLGERAPAARSGGPGRTAPATARWSLTSIGDLSEALVQHSLGRPEPLFCPSSLEWDVRAPKPFVKTSSGGVIPQWKSGETSYFYLIGLLNTMTFENTFEPGKDSPDVVISHDRFLNKVNSRVLLAGDRTIELRSPLSKLPGSNHQRTGGWFCYTTGDVLWRNWNTLKGHPGSLYIWYWPSQRTSTP